MIGSVWPGSSDAHYQFDLRRSDVPRVSISRKLSTTLARASVVSPVGEPRDKDDVIRSQLNSGKRSSGAAHIQLQALSVDSSRPQSGNKTTAPPLRILLTRVVYERSDCRFQRGPKRHYPTPPLLATSCLRFPPV